MAATVTYNQALAERVYAAIRADQAGEQALPYRWNQATFIDPLDEDEEAFEEAIDQPEQEPVTVCGAELCFAGHAVLAAGWKLVRNPFYGGTEIVDPGSGRLGYIPLVARAELGLDDVQADVLFEPGNDLGQLRALLDAIAAGIHHRAALEVVRDGLPLADVLTDGEETCA